MKKNNNFLYILKRVKIFGYHGVNPAEQKEGQFFFVSVKYLSSLSNTVLISDNIKNVVDYTSVINDIESIFSSKRYSLIEILAKDIYNHLKSKYKLYNLKVIIEKPDSPISNVDNIIVEYSNE